jgi:hypothetical protein
MKNNFTLSLIIVFILLIGTNIIYSKSNFLVTGGLVLPNSEVSNVFNSTTIKTSDTNNPVINITNPDLGAAYSIAAKLSFKLSEDAIFWGGFGLIKFAKFNYDLLNPAKNENAGYIVSQTSIYPLNAGVNYYIFDNSYSIYGIGNLSYNFITSTFNTVNSKITIPVGKNITDTRLGYSVGIGFELPLEKLSIVMEAIYSDLNYIGKDTKENTKSIINLCAGFRF